MKSFLKIGAIALLVALISACAGNGGSYYERWENCAISGAVTAGAAGAIIDDTDAALASAAGGAIIGGLICANMDHDKDGVKNVKDKCPGTRAAFPVDADGCDLDSDGDGVPDGADDCPGTPAGTQVNASGCPIDDDGDGVANNMDKCPGTPAGTKVGADGCELDSDGDGVVDSKDECPATPPNTAVDPNGCKHAETHDLEGVNFKTDSAELTDTSSSILDEAVRVLKKYGDMNAAIAGHTDSTGATDHNQGLSERRATTVNDYLVAHGIDASRLSTKGYGESMPVADNNTNAGRAANRRVELNH
jgi:OOP family OmpA-OmpF porin